MMETDETVIPKLIVKTLSDRSIEVELSSTVKNIGDVKLVLEKHCSLLASQQSIVFMGRLLADQDPVPSSPNPLVYLFYYEPAALITDPIESAIDWDTKNRMKIFKGLYLFSIRKFAAATPLLIDSLTTFNETHFIPFKNCVKYAIIAAMLVLDRPAILQQLIKSPEVLEVINELPHLDVYINAFYNCRYQEFFSALGKVEDEFRNDWLIFPHTQFIIKEMRIRAYSQILQSYRSLTLASMAQSFGVSVDFIDREVSRFIAANRLDCIIDKVSGVVFTSPPDRRNSEYITLLKTGDVLTARMQKLGKILTY